MGSDDLFWKKKQRDADLKRNQGTKKPLQTFLIVCEGEKTEPNYFRSFRLSNATVDARGTGRNTSSLIQYIIDTTKSEQYDQIWAVFDKDSFSDQQFNAAIDKATRKNIRVAYSNEAFELWYLLHFNYYSTALTRDQYIAKLDELLGEKYLKNSTEMYDKLKNEQNIAIKNAKKLLDEYNNGETPSQKNPSTTVFELVEQLNSYLK